MTNVCSQNFSFSQKPSIVETQLKAVMRGSKSSFRSKYATAIWLKILCFIKLANKVELRKFIMAPFAPLFTRVIFMSRHREVTRDLKRQVEKMSLLNSLFVQS